VEAYLTLLEAVVAGVDFRGKKGPHWEGMQFVHANEPDLASG